MIKASPVSQVTAFALLTSFTMLLSGCSETAQIETYRTDKPDAVHEANHVERQAPDAPARPGPAAGMTPAGSSAGSPAVGSPVRMFGAIVPQGDQAWFYKLTGPADAVQSVVEPLAEFVSQVKYSGNSASWELPEGWEQLPGNQFRYATLKIPHGEGTLEMSVSALPGSPNEAEQVLDNVNRWRGQVGLPPTDLAAITAAGSDATAELSVRSAGEGKIYLVNLVGQQQETGMRPPFAR